MRKVLLLVAGILLIVAGVFTAVTATIVVFILPESFASTVRIVLRVADASAIATELEKIPSQSILYPVITNLHLNTEWAKKLKEENDLRTDTTYAILKSRIDVRQARNTSVIEIKAFSDDANEASAIANEIAAVYRSSPLSLKTPDGKAAVDILDKAEPGLRPVRPNKPLAILLGCAFGAVLAACGGVLLLVYGREARSAARVPAAGAG